MGGLEAIMRVCRAVYVRTEPLTARSRSSCSVGTTRRGRNEGKGHYSSLNGGWMRYNILASVLWRGFSSSTFVVFVRNTCGWLFEKTQSIHQ